MNGNFIEELGEKPLEKLRKLEQDGRFPEVKKKADGFGVDSYYETVKGIYCDECPELEIKALSVLKERYIDSPFGHIYVYFYDLPKIKIESYNLRFDLTKIEDRIQQDFYSRISGLTIAEIQDQSELVNSILKKKKLKDFLEFRQEFFWGHFDVQLCVEHYSFLEKQINKNLDTISSKLKGYVKPSDIETLHINTWVYRRLRR